MGEAAPRELPGQGVQPELAAQEAAAERLEVEEARAPRSVQAVPEQARLAGLAWPPQVQAL